jgi:predicted transcriptional regulator
MRCSPELEELLNVVFKLKSREVEILMELCGSEMTVKQLSDQIDLDRTTVQRYLSGLEKASLVKVSKNGREHVYSMDSDSLKRKARQELEAWTEEKQKAIEKL